MRWAFLGQPASERRCLPAWVEQGTPVSALTPSREYSARGLGSWVERWWVCRAGPHQENLLRAEEVLEEKWKCPFPFTPSFVDGSGAAHPVILRPHASPGTADLLSWWCPPPQELRARRCHSRRGGWAQISGSPGNLLQSLGNIFWGSVQRRVEQEIGHRYHA